MVVKFNNWTRRIVWTDSHDFYRWDNLFLSLYKPWFLSLTESAAQKHIKWQSFLGKFLRPALLVPELRWELYWWWLVNFWRLCILKCIPVLVTKLKTLCSARHRVQYEYVLPGPRETFKHDTASLALGQLKELIEFLNNRSLHFDLMIFPVLKKRIVTLSEISLCGWKTTKGRFHNIYIY